jgi:hypothetical protein
VEFVDVVARQAHPGPDVPPYSSIEQKRRDAITYKTEEHLPWRVLIDRLDGEVHRRYGSLPDPSYLIDREGRVAFYDTFTHAPTLHRALEALRDQHWRGVALGGHDRRPHLFATVAAGWPALRRGLPQSAVDLETAAPGASLLPFLGYQARGFLSPLALRDTPLPRAARIGLSLAVIAGAAALATRRTRALPSPAGLRRDLARAPR